MKQPKKLNRAQKEAVSAANLNPEHWMLVREMEFYIKIVNKETGKQKIIDKFRKGKR